MNQFNSDIKQENIYPNFLKKSEKSDMPFSSG